MVEDLVLTHSHLARLKDGENHDQSGSAWRRVDESGRPIGASVLDAEDVGTKQRIPGWVNWTDLGTCARVIAHLNDSYNRRSDGVTYIFTASKHGGAVVVGLGETQIDAVRRGLAGDVNSPFGGFLGFNTPLERETAEFIDRMFIEGTFAPDYEEAVVDLLRSTERVSAHANRILARYPVRTLAELDGLIDYRTIKGGLLTQTPQNLRLDVRNQACVVSGNQRNGDSMDVSCLGDEIVSAAQLAVDMGGLIASNTVLYAVRNALVGVGNGVGNRYFAARNGRASIEESLWNNIGDKEHARRALYDTPFTLGDFRDVLDPDMKLVVYSDGFFPKPDALIEALGIDRVNPAFSGGVFNYAIPGKPEQRMLLKRDNYTGEYDGRLVAKAVVQPGLCLGDADAKAITNQFGIPMIFLVSQADYNRREELLAKGDSDSKAEARKIEGARRFSHQSC